MVLMEYFEFYSSVRNTSKPEQIFMFLLLLDYNKENNSSAKAKYICSATEARQSVEYKADSAASPAKSIKKLQHRMIHTSADVFEV